MGVMGAASAPLFSLDSSFSSRVPKPKRKEGERVTRSTNRERVLTLLCPDTMRAILDRT